MEKSADAFRTISEVAEELDLPQHVLRFWETRFSQIKPLKRGGGRRYYRPEDVELLRGDPPSALWRGLHDQGRAAHPEGAGRTKAVIAPRRGSARLPADDRFGANAGPRRRTPTPLNPAFDHAPEPRAVAQSSAEFAASYAATTRGGAGRTAPNVRASSRPRRRANSRASAPLWLRPLRSASL